MSDNYCVITEVWVQDSLADLVSTMINQTSSHPFQNQWLLYNTLSTNSHLEWPLLTILDLQGISNLIIQPQLDLFHYLDLLREPLEDLDILQIHSLNTG